MPFARIRTRTFVALAAFSVTATVGLGVATSDAGVPGHTSAGGGVAAGHGPDLTSHAFFVDVLQRMHLPATQPNLDALYAVESREGDNNRYNPLNVVQPEPGSSAYNSIGVQRYASFATGVTGTAHLLGNGHWTGVRAALRKGDSTSAVLAAFGRAYTWSGGISFRTDPAALEAEAVRDVGGKYADRGLAARRAAGRQSVLHAAIGRLSRPMVAATRTAGNAHSDWAGQQALNISATAVATAKRRVATALATRAATERQLFVSTVNSQYMSGGAAASAGELLKSRTASGYLSYLTLQGYVNAGQRDVLKHYAADQAQADASAAALARVQATVRATAVAMARDQHTWTAAQRRATALRTRLVGVLHAATADSITQPVAAAELAKIQPAGSARSAGHKHAKHGRKHTKR